MTYEEFVITKVINKNVSNYEVLIESVLQTKVVPSKYLLGVLSKQAISTGLNNIFGKQENKNKNTSFNFYFLGQYRKEVLKIDEENTKVCSSCNLELPISSFYSNGYQSNGKKKYKAKCKHCQTLCDKTRTEDIILKIVGVYSCKICGYSKCKQALEFHHLDPKLKEYQITNLNTHKEDTIVKELEKCILVCANCHREIHYGLHPEYLLE